MTLATEIDWSLFAEGGFNQCSHCSVEFEGGDEYCSRECRLADNNEEIPCNECGDVFLTVGRYQTHVTKHHTREGFGGSWYRMRRQAITRDGGVCQVCGSEPTSPIVHHITERWRFETEGESHWLGNLITVCDGCHQGVEQLDPVEVFKKAFSE